MMKKKSEKNVVMEMTNLNVLNEQLDGNKYFDNESQPSSQQINKNNLARPSRCSKLKRSICKHVPNFMKTLLFLIICLVICNILLIGVTAYGLAMGLMSSKSLSQSSNLANTTTAQTTIIINTYTS